jgi:DNA-binding NarL/FixJ family response regulator
MSERDRIILDLVAQGIKYPEIGQRMHLTAARICQIVKKYRPDVLAS